MPEQEKEQNRKLLDKKNQRHNSEPILYTRKARKAAWILVEAHSLLTNKKSLGGARMRAAIATAKASSAEKDGGSEPREESP